MATPAETIALPRRYGSGAYEWLTTTNHKNIGILYLATAFIFFLIGGLEALLIRLQLGAPNNAVVSPDVYNQIFTMHGTTMIFLFAMPILVGFGNYVVPLMIGARDMAFPRLNALSYWFFLLGGLLLYSSFVLGGAPNAGWFAYAPLTSGQYSPTHGMDFWALGIAMTGLGSTVGAINFIVTILNMRAPGMTLFKMPLFVWQVLVTTFLILFAMPSLTVDATLLFLERNIGSPFYLADKGGDPLLWQHLFWFFGHPEVYILILPAFGIISEVLPVFARKPIFGYGAVVYSGIAIGFLGFTVWAHHMFAVGMSPIADAVFSLDSMIIAVPTSIKIFNWIATLWGGKINLKAPVLFGMGFIAMFLIGGLSGISLAVVPVDFQVEDTYYVVAHLHYVLFGGTVFAVFSGIYYWFPKITGRLLNDRLGKWQFWIMLLGFNLTFFPMHILGLLGMPRRIFTYGPGLGWDTWNLIESIGAFVIATAVLIFLYNYIISVRRGEVAGDDPWDAQTLEWMTSSPPPAYNFAVIPVVHSRRPFWDLKYREELDKELAGQAPSQGSLQGPLQGALQGSSKESVKEPVTRPTSGVPTGTSASSGGVAPAAAARSRTLDPALIQALSHLQENSINPLIIAVGIFIASFGLIYLVWPVVVVGIVILFAGILAWAREPR